MVPSIVPLVFNELRRNIVTLNVNVLLISIYLVNTLNSSLVIRERKITILLF